MKKYMLIAAVAMLSLVGCKSKEEVRVYEHTAAQDIVGNYEGTWSATTTSGLVTVYTEGCSVRFEEYKDTIPYVAMIYPRCDQAGWATNMRGITNVVHAGDALNFNNDKSANGLGSSFFGKVDSEGNMTMSINFQEFNEETWQTDLVMYKFSGKRVAE